MTVISFSSVDSQIYGFLYFPSQEGSFEFRFVDLLYADIDAVTSLPNDFYFNVFGTLIPFVKIISAIDNLPFTSRPEAAYKFGSFSWVKAYEREVLEDETVSYFPVKYSSEYIIYPTQTLGETKTVLRLPSPLIDDYVLNLDSGEQSDTTDRTIDTRTIDSGYGVSSKVAIGGVLNLPLGIVANLKIFYTLRIIGVGSIATIGDYQPILI